MKKRSYLKKVLKYFTKHKKHLTVLLISLILSSIVSIIVPFIVAKEYEYVVGIDIPNIIKYGILIILTGIIDVVLETIINIFSDKLQKKVELDVQKDITNELFKLEISNFDKKGTSFFIERAVHDTQDLVGGIFTLRYYLFSIISVSGVLVYILAASPKIFILMLIVSLLEFLIDKKRFSYFEKRYKTRREKRENYQSTFSELIRGIRDIKVLNLRKTMTTKIIKNQEELNDISNRELLENNFFRDVNNVIELFAKFGILLFSIYLLSKGEIEGSSLLIIYMYQDRVLYLSTMIGNVYDNIKKMNLTMKNIFDILDSKEYPKEKFGLIENPKFEGNIEFKNVNFSYNEDKQILKDVNFKIKPNGVVGFVGKSGSGKSTLFSLISKLYTVNDGEILIDGKNINDYTEETLRGNISVITQDPYIFNMSIKDNIKIVKPSISDEEIKEKCKLAELSNYIESLPDKYDTIVGENGVILSGGLKQRLAIVRALVKESEIILLDEATSSLDNEIQEHIMDAIKNISNDYTILIIAHRLSTVKDCDKIVVIDDGEVKGYDTHAKLIKENQIYSSLYKKELK